MYIQMININLRVILVILEFFIVQENGKIFKKLISIPIAGYEFYGRLIHIM